MVDLINEVLDSSTKTPFKLGKGRSQVMELIRVNGKTTTARFNRALNGLMEDVFGFSFARFQALGVWDEQYEYFSVMDESKMVANCGAYHMQMVVDGIKQEFLQFGAVAVHPAYRGKGLGRLVMEQALGEYPDVPAFLYANLDAKLFYTKLGFVPQEERQPFVTVRPGPRKPGLERLELIYPEVGEYLESRGCFSPCLDCVNQEALNWFHLVYQFQDNLYHVPELGVMLVMEERGSEVFLHDVAAPQKVSFECLLPYIQGEGVERVTFGFRPDRLDSRWETEPSSDPDSVLMARGWEGDLGCFIPRLVRT
ncbi:MAG: hypothetical protein AA931_06320 [Peptococcaceae bacterium 1109]|nr:MAG: hypothetical protein AA931_06320 [Peptococcaceae bacterium 1109]